MIIDTNFGISDRTMVIFYILRNKFSYFDYGKQTHFTFSSLYNCRENGICVSIKSINGCKFVVFGESRGSDKIFVTTCNYAWADQLNPPLLSDIAESDYFKRKCFKYNEFNKAAECVFSFITW